MTTWKNKQEKKPFVQTVLLSQSSLWSSPKDYTLFRETDEASRHFKVPRTERNIKTAGNDEENIGSSK
jgi:hypothetical protein